MSTQRLQPDAPHAVQVSSLNTHLYLSREPPARAHGPAVMRSVPNDTDAYLGTDVRAAAYAPPRKYHHSNERYVKNHIFFANGVVTSAGHSERVIEALQKGAVITGDRRMISDWSNEAARLGAARSAEAPLQPKQAARRFVCMRNAADILDRIRLGFPQKPLRPEQILSIIAILGEYKQVTEKRYERLHLLDAKQQAYKQRRAQLQKELDACLERVCNDTMAATLRREIDLLASLASEYGWSSPLPSGRNL